MATKPPAKKTAKAATPTKATSAAKPEAAGEEKRERGRPMIGGAGGPFTRVNLSLDEGSKAIAARIHANTSAAVRLALEYWDRHNPEKKPAR